MFKFSGLAEEIGQISAYYRSRKLNPIFVIQAFWQLDELLRQQVWSMGNLVTFTLDQHDDAFAFAKQTIRYDPLKAKRTANTETGMDQPEPDVGQYRQECNWLQRLKWRQLVMRRYLNERDKEEFISFVPRTREKPPINLPDGRLEAIKEELFSRRAIEIRDVIEVMKERVLTTVKKDPSERQGLSRK